MFSERAVLDEVFQTKKPSGSVSAKFEPMTRLVRVPAAELRNRSVVSPTPSVSVFRERDRKNPPWRLTVTVGKLPPAGVLKIRPPAWLFEDVTWSVPESMMKLPWLRWRPLRFSVELPMRRITPKPMNSPAKVPSWVWLIVSVVPSPRSMKL